MIDYLKNKTINNLPITKEEALWLYNSDIKKLCESANTIRKHFCANKFDLCTIINAKSGKCSEDCKFCAQSSFYKTGCVTYSLLSGEKIIEQAKMRSEQGIKHFSIVTSGRVVTEKDLHHICSAIEKAKKERLAIKFCASLGLLNESQYQKLYNAGLRRIHNNLETSEQYFSSMCTTHTYKDKITSIANAQKVGMYICSGGIFGIGESIADRIDMAFALKKLKIQSIPINILTPIPGTKYEHNEILSKEIILRIVATYRFILPNSFIRLAGGRNLLADKGYSCFSSGANATITSHMLTTNGITVENDKKMLEQLHYDF